MSSTISLIVSFGLGVCLAQNRQRFGAMPSITASPALMPRYFIDRSFPLAKRQNGCSNESHSCGDVGFGDQCCDNDSYCYVDNDGNPRCCPIGSNCINNSPCKSIAYRCVRIVSTTGSPSTSVLQTGCCPRKCPATSSYLCPEDRGGGCCAYGSECGQGGKCITTLGGSSTMTLTPAVEGCTAGQHKCEDGMGCCDETWTCTQVSGEGYCAPKERAQPSVESIQDDDGEMLSQGAMAGISAGAVVGAAAIIGAATWLCLRKRKRRRRASTQPDRGQSNSESPDPQPNNVDAVEVSTSPRSARAGRGLAQDYSSPNPNVGPFTERGDATPTSPSPGRAVPAWPQAPGDIAAPVEIDSASVVTENQISPLSAPSPLSPSQITNIIYELES